MNLQTIKSHRLLVVGVPVVTVALILIIHGVTLLTGRAPEDPSLQPDMLIPIALRAVVIIVALIFTVLVKNHEKLNKEFKDLEPTWQTYVASRAHTFGLIALFCYVLTH